MAELEEASQMREIYLKSHAVSFKDGRFVL